MSSPFEQFLKSHTVSDLKLPAKEKIVSVAPDTSVRKILQLMRDKDIRSLPVIGPSGAFGFVDRKDVAYYLSSVFEKHEHEPSILGDVFYQSPAAQLIGFSAGPNSWVVISPETTLFHACELFCQHSASRFPVMEGSELISVMTHNSLLEYFLKNLDAFGDSIKKSVESVFPDSSLGHVYPILADVPAIGAFHQFKKEKCASIPVMDEDGFFVAGFSTNDVTALAEEYPIERLNRDSIRRFITMMRMSEIQEIMPTMDTRKNVPIELVLKKIQATHCSSLFVCDNKGVPVGLISLVDILSHLLNP